MRRLFQKIWAWINAQNFETKQPTHEETTVVPDPKNETQEPTQQESPKKFTGLSSSLQIFHYDPDEFLRNDVNWFEYTDPRLLVMIDIYRFMWGLPVDISPHPHALGREDGDSYHNWKLHGWVKAIDVMPRGILSYELALKSVAIAREIGFTGIGFYPHWEIRRAKRAGLHLDVRERNPNNPSLWGGIKEDKTQIYVSITDALNLMK